MSISPNSRPATTADDAPLVPWNRIERFVGQLTHDIRNGLNAVELQLTFLGEISTDPEAVEEVTRLRHTSANIARQLQALRTTTGMATPHPLEYPVAEFFEDLRERFAKLHPRATDKIIWNVGPTGKAMLAIDPDLTLNVLLELFSNALHFNETEMQPIRVQITTTDECTLFLLRETQAEAPTIPPEQWGRTPLLTTRRGAYGLGLFRVRRCLEAQGGTFDVEYSAAENLLTTKVMLPGVLPQES